MSADRLLHGGLVEAATRSPDALACTCEGEKLSYLKLARAAHRLAAQLTSLGVARGDRVGILLPKSLDAVIAMFGVLEAGGVYVPTGEQSPPAHQLHVLQDCGVRGVIATPDQVAGVLDFDESFVRALDFVLCREPVGSPDQCTPWERGEQPSGPTAVVDIDPGQPAYILYTSGSTGQPKGVVVSHQGARCFVDWAIRTFGIGPADVLANHAQLNFDLSVLDVFAAITAGAHVHLLTAGELLRPDRVVELLSEQGITLWYSVPSALHALAQDGDLAGRPPSTLSRVLFAGEVFPIPWLREVMRALPNARLYNLFGPTETNVCTWHALPGVPAAEAESIPIGAPCDHLRVMLRDEAGKEVPDGSEGELCVAGSSVMLGYHGRDELTRDAFWFGPNVDGDARWYRTGDRARRDADGQLWFLGRRDRQVKRRGYRIELGAIEAALSKMPGVREVAVVSEADAAQGCRITAWVAPQTEGRPDVLTVKLWCGTVLPRYMVPDAVEFRAALPRTPTGKLDRGSLV